jgi:hypothetical protein
MSHFDLDSERGTQGELFVENVRAALAKRTSNIEVKTDAHVMKKNGPDRFYVEYECRGRDGNWRDSGIMTTKAGLWFFVFGKHPAGLVVETSWLRKAFDLAKQDKRNHASMDYGENPTKGILVYTNHLRLTRDEAFDEH